MAISYVDDAMDNDEIAACGAIELDAGRCSPTDMVAVPTWAVGREI